MQLESLSDSFLLDMWNHIRLRFTDPPYSCPPQSQPDINSEFQMRDSNGSLMWVLLVLWESSLIDRNIRPARLDAEQS